MYKMSNEREDPSSRTVPYQSDDEARTAVFDHSKRSGNSDDTKPSESLLNNIITLIIGKPKQDNTLRETIEEYIIPPGNGAHEDETAANERVLLSNILKLRDVTVYNVMVPRADIVAMDINTSQDELFELLKNTQYSRFPVYRETLDDVVGTIHLKDIIAAIAQGKEIDPKSMLSDLPVVSPSMPVLDLLLKMRQSRRHMALVVDEYGGIDGLVTIGDVLEFIVGEIDDEHDIDEDHQIIEKPDGAYVVDARMDIESFENTFGSILNEEERSENDTLAGLVSFIAGRVPARGEMITHENGMIFEVVDADPRRIHKLKIRNIPKYAA